MHMILQGNSFQIRAIYIALMYTRWQFEITERLHTLLLIYG